MFLKWEGIFFNISSGKEAMTMKMVQPMVMKMDAGSKKLMRFLIVMVMGGDAAKSTLDTMPTRQTANAPTTPTR